MDMEDIKMDKDYLEQLILLSKLKFEYLNFDAVFSDETEAYRRPLAPRRGERVTVRLRTAAANTDGAYICFDDKQVPMSVAVSTEAFDYYSVDIICPDEPVFYYFKIVKDDREYFYKNERIDI